MALPLPRTGNALSLPAGEDPLHYLSFADFNAVLDALAGTSVTGSPIGLDPALVTATGSTTARALRDVAADVNAAADQVRGLTSRIQIPERLNYPPVTSGTLAQDFRSGTFTADTNNQTTGLTITRDATRGAAKISWTSAANGQQGGLKATGSWDFSASTLFALDLGVDAGEQFTRVSVYLAFDVSGFTNYAWLDLPSGNWPKPARFTIPWLRSAMAVVGTPAWNAVRRIEIRLYHQATNAGADTFYLYGFWSGVAAKTKVLIQFDDGVSSQYTEAFSRMSAAGMVGSLNVNGSTINTASHLTLSQLSTVYAAGWDIANHTWDHIKMAQMFTGTYGPTQTAGVATASVPAAESHGLLANGSFTLTDCDSPGWNGVWTVATVTNPQTFTFAVPAGLEPNAGSRCAMRPPGVTLDAVRQSVQLQKEWMITNGFTRALAHMAYPYGYSDSATRSILRDEKGFKTGRGVSSWPLGTNDYSVSRLTGIDQSLAFELPVVPIASPTTAAAVLALVDTAIAKGNDVILLGHNITSGAPTAGYDITTTEFQSLIDGLVTRRDAGSVEVVTVSDWYGRL
jgi:hypothetical protein